MIKSHEIMNQLNEQSQFRHKGKDGIRYLEEGESSQQGAKKSKRPTCSCFHEIGNTSNKCQSSGKLKFNGKCYNFNEHAHNASECKEKPNLKVKFHSCKKQGHKS